MLIRKIVVVIALSAVPSACFAATSAYNTSFLHNFNQNPAGQFSLASSNLNGTASNNKVDSNSLKIPSLLELNQEIDRNDGVIERKALPDFKLPASTKKIINKLPKNLVKKRKSKKGKVKIKAADFSGNETDTFTDTTVPTENVFTGKAKSAFDIDVSKTVKAVEPDKLSMASKAYSVGQYESAIALFKQVLEKDAKDRDALFGLATSYHKIGQKNQAKVYYAKLLDVYPYDSEGQNNFLALIGEEAPQDALRELDELAKSNPDYASIYAHKSAIYQKMGDDNSAIKNLYQALKIDSANNDYKYNLAILFDKNGYYENAAKLYNDLIEDSYKGIPIPTSRSALTDRVTFISTKIPKQ